MTILKPTSISSSTNVILTVVYKFNVVFDILFFSALFHNPIRLNLINYEV